MRTCFNYMCTIRLARARAYQILKQSSFQGLDMGTHCTVLKCCMKDKRIFGIITTNRASFCLFYVFCISRCVLYVVGFGVEAECTVSTTDRNSGSVSRVCLYVCVCILCFCNSISLVLRSTSVARAECSVSTTDGASIVTLGYKATRGSTDKR